MMPEAKTGSPEMVAAQSAYKRAIYDRFDQINPDSSEIALLLFLLQETEDVKVGVQIPVIEFSVRGDSLPQNLQELVDKIYDGQRFASFRVVAGGNRLALIASNPDGTVVGTYATLRETDGKGTFVGREIAFDIEAAGCTVATINDVYLQSCDSSIADTWGISTRVIEPQAINDLASLIEHNRTTSKVSIYPKDHFDLPSSFRTGSPSF